jgi:hypothetical protein
MDQSLFAAPHSLSQRITSFFACACQGIHQMPLRHLIVLIANAHHLADAPYGTTTNRVTFYNPVHSTMPSTCSTSLLDWGHAERPACKLVYKTSFSRLNPGSRGQATIISDPSEVLQRTPTTNDQSDKLPTSSGPSFVSGRLGHQRRHWNRPRTCTTLR